MRKITNQHGDVLLIKTDKIPTNAKRISIGCGKFVVEKGEGIHTHTIEDTKNIEVFMSDDNMYLNVLKDLDIDHEEHGKQTIEKGLYLKDIEIQYDYEAEEKRRVQD